MTLDTNLSKAVYQGNGVTTAFPFAFRVWSSGQLVVTMTDAAGTSTDVTGECAITLSDTGGSVTYPVSGDPLPTGAALAITRNMPFVQGVDLVSASRFDPQVIEDALDQAAAERQQTLEMMQRAVILPATSDESPEDVVAAVYASRDAAAASAGTAQTAAAAAELGASTAESTVQTATAAAVTEATTQATSAAASATAAQASADAAAAASEGLAPRMDAVETVAAGAKAVTDTATETPTAASIPISVDNSRIAPGWVPGLFLGDIRLLPYRAADLATYCPGWHHCNGDGYDVTSAVGIALAALPDNLKSDWGITVSGSTIYVPSLYYTDGRGYFLRAVDGSNRQVGSVVLDQLQGHTHGAVSGNNDAYPGPPYFKLANTSNGSSPSYTTVYGVDGSNGTPRIGTETRVLNIGMTPAIFLNV